MSDIRDLLKGYTTEAAVADMSTSGPIEELEEAMLDAGESSMMPTVAGTVSDATTAGDMADQFGDLEQRADELEEKAANAESDVEKEIVNVSAECLVREFNTLITSYGMHKDWHSYSIEAAQTPGERIAAVKADAQKYGAVTRKLSETLGDLSTEAAGIIKILGRHKAKLEVSRAALINASKRLDNNMGDLREHPKQITNDGMRTFLTRNGQEVHNLPEAIHAEATWLSKAHSASVAALQVINDAAHKIKANPDTPLDQLLDKNHFKAIRDLTTSKGGLMGDHTVEIKKDDGPIPRYARTNDRKARPAAGLIGAVTGAAGAIAGGNLIGTIGMAIGGMSAGPVLLGAAAAAVGTAVAAKHGHNNGSKVTSIASAADLKKTISEVLQYTKYTANDMSWDIFHELDDVSGKGAAKLADAAWAVYMLLEILYDQALYTTTRMAILARDMS